MADAIVLRFTNDAKVVQFLTTAPGTSFARLIDFPLGGGYTVVRGDDRSAIYNAHDDKMYFLGTKTGTHFLVQYDPRTLAITDEMALPAGWTLANSILRDCTDERAWIYSSLDSSTRAFDTNTMTQVFSDGGALNTTPYATTFAMISCGNGVALISDDGDFTIMHRVTVTGATTFTDATLTLSGSPIGGNNGSYRRRWNESSNTAVVTYEITASPVDPIGAIIDVAAMTATDITAPDTSTKLFDNGIFWDTVSDKFVGSISIGADFGIGVFNDDGTYVGAAALASSDWDSGSPAMPLGNDLAWSMSFAFAGGGAGGFDMAVPIITPAETYEATSFNTTPSGLSFDSVHVCIAPGTAVPPEPPEEPPRMETSIGGGGSCGVQFERLEMFHLLKSLMGSGRTLEQAMKFLEQDDVDFLEEEELLDDLPQEIPKPARQGASPKMVDRRINLAPITKLNSLIAEFETKLQNCRTTQRREYDK